MPHDTETLLEDVRFAGELIQRFTADRSLVDFQSDLLLHSAVERQFIVIGEALHRLEKLDPITVQRITDHRRIIGFRNVLVHGYDAIDDSVVWLAVQQHLPELLHQVEELLNKLGPA